MLLLFHWGRQCWWWFCAQYIGQLLLIRCQCIRIDDSFCFARQLQRIQILQFRVVCSTFNDQRKDFLWIFVQHLVEIYHMIKGNFT